MFDIFKNKKNSDTEDDPALAAELMAKGELLMENDEPRKAEKYYLRAMDIYVSLLKEDDSLYRNLTAKCADELGAVYECLERYTDAFDKYSMAASLLSETAGENDPKLLEQLADAYCNVGDTYFFRERYDEAEKEYNKAVEVSLKLVNLDAETYLVNLAYCYDCIAKSYSGKEDYLRCIEYYEKVIEIYEKKAADHSGSPLDGSFIEVMEELAGAYSDIGYIYSCLENYTDAEGYYIKAANIYRDLAVNDPDSFSDSLSAQYADLSALYEDMEKLDLARDYLRKSQNLDI